VRFPVQPLKTRRSLHGGGGAPVGCGYLSKGAVVFGSGYDSKAKEGKGITLLAFFLFHPSVSYY